ncbi:MAG: hypothetical protein Q4B48_08665, partial [Syntrophomonadaceae bacterium]|nr:hypothetical protein [Syntrophomonadaceae bacterium]
MRRSLSLFIAFMLLAALPGLALAAPGESLSPIAGNPQPADGPGTGGTGGSSTGGAVAATGDAPASTGRLAGQLQRFIAAQNNEKKAILYTGYVIQPDSVTLKIHKQFYGVHPDLVKFNISAIPPGPLFKFEVKPRISITLKPSANYVSLSSLGEISNTDPNSTLLITTEVSERDLTDLGFRFGAGVALSAGAQQSAELTAEELEAIQASIYNDIDSWNRDDSSTTVENFISRMLELRAAGQGWARVM